MAKLTLADLANLNNPTSAVASINANNALIEAAVENTLSRDGTTPNTMNANLDMNGFSIINIGSAGIFSLVGTISSDDTDTQLTNAQSGTLFTQANFSAKRTYTLPQSPVLGTVFSFGVTDGGTVGLTISRGANNQFVIVRGGQPEASSISSTVHGSVITMVQVETDYWLVLYETGTWTQVND